MGTVLAPGLVVLGFSPRYVLPLLPIVLPLSLSQRFDSGSSRNEETSRGAKTSQEHAVVMIGFSVGEGIRQGTAGAWLLS